MLWFIVGGLGFALWLSALTLELRRFEQELVLITASLRQLVKPQFHLGGRSRSRRRTDFRVPVALTGFVRVLDHAKACRVLDLSRSGAQIAPTTGTLPLGELGVLTVEFNEFGSLTTQVKVVRHIPESDSYGVHFVDPPHEFYTRCVHAVETAIKAALDSL